MRCVNALGVGGAALTVILGFGLGLGCGKSKQSAPTGQSAPAEQSAAAGNADNGTTVTMWTRAATEKQSKLLVDAYNASHKNKVELTVVPTDNYVQKIATAAGGNALPDLFAADVIFAPNYTAKLHLFLDITARIDALPFKDALAPAHIKLGTYQGKKYAIPHTIDLSVIFWNKDLYAKAGLDPEKGPTTLKELAEHAKKIQALGGDINGTTLGGNCGGCGVFTIWPSIWAAGGDVMNAEGTAGTLDTKPVKDVLGIWRQLYADGIAQPGSKEEQGPTWVGRFQKGNVGVGPMPSTTLAMMDSAGLKVGVIPIPGPDGGQSTFVGGDVLGISATSKHADAAWDFMAWSLSDAAQVEVLAKNKDLIARTDLAENKYSAADPRVVTTLKVLAQGKTPFALNFNQTFNDPQGPWLAAMRGALFGPDLDKALAEGNLKVTASLAQK
jgi:multiple sugar transport system substrate-binding protein